MSFAPYLYFSFIFIAIFSIVEVSKNFSHSVLLKIQFILLLVLPTVVNMLLFKGQLSNIEISIVRLLLDCMPFLVLNIVLILYVYQIAIWVFIVEGLLAIIGAVLVFFYGKIGVANTEELMQFKFYTIASTNPLPILIYRIALLLLSAVCFILLFLKISFFEKQKTHFFGPLRIWTTLMILAFILYIIENTLPVHTYTHGIYSTQILPIYVMLGILLRPKSINSPWYQYTLGGINKVELSKDDFEIAFYTNHFYLKDNASIENLAGQLDANKISVTAFIKKNTGLGFADLLNKSRVDYLVDLLKKRKHEEYTIEALAKMSGFGSRQTMYKAFAKFKKQSPTDFIDTLKK
jgi:AraC-like DNA-binding protein